MILSAGVFLFFNHPIILKSVAGDRRHFHCRLSSCNISR